MRNIALIFLLLFTTLAYSLTFTDAVIDGRTVGGNIVSDRDTDPETPAFGNVQGSGNVTITWGEVNTDSNGDPLTVYYYELRYRTVGSTEYTAITIPAGFTGHALTLGTGSYEGFVEAISSAGVISTDAIFTFEVL